MHTTYEHHEGWFPIIGVRFERLSDLVFVSFIVTLIITILIYCLTAGRKLAIGILKPIGLVLIGISMHITFLAIETGVSIYHIVKNIPLSWYSLTAVTVIPIAVDVPRQGVIWLLLAYCVVNGWVVIYGIGCSKPKPEKIPKEDSGKQPTKTTPQIQAEEIRSQFFTGMRINIEK